MTTAIALIEPGLCNQVTAQPAPNSPFAPLTRVAVGSNIDFVESSTAMGLEFMGSYGTVLEMDVDLTDTQFEMLDIIQRNMGNGASVADIDNDGDFDVLLLGQQGHPAKLFLNDLGAGTFSDVTAAYGLSDGAVLGQSRVALFADFDNDGWKDLVVGNDTLCCGTEPLSSIYRNSAGTSFVDVSQDSGFTMTGHIVGGMGVVDYDQDGLIDIYVTTWGARQADSYTLLEGYNRLFRNMGAFQFEDVTREVGLGKLQTNCFGPIFADFDRDGDPDLFIAVDGYSDVFFRNDDGVFVDITLEAGTTHIGSDMGVAPGDFDGDGDIDLYVTNATDPAGNFGGNTLLVNQFMETGKLTFVDEALERGVWYTAWGWGTEWFDVENDGDLDIFAVNGFDEFVLANYGPTQVAGWLNAPTSLFVNNGTGNFTLDTNNGSDLVGDSRAAVAFDVNRDGLQDLLVTNMNAAPMLMINTTTQPGHWFELDLTGGGPVCRDAVGAHVEIDAGGKTYQRDTVGGGSYISGRPLSTHFGIGSATLINQLRVTWPDGHVNVANNLAVDQVFSGVYFNPVAPLESDESGSVSGHAELNDSNWLRPLQLTGPSRAE